MSKVIVIGGGAAGMYAAVMAAEQGHEVHLYEKNEKLGKKLFITGKGRCNVTNAADPEEQLRAIVSNNKFLYSAFYSHTSADVMEFFEAAGLRLKIERGGRVFPVSEHSSDVIRTLEREMKRRGVTVRLNTAVKSIIAESQVCKGIELADGTRCLADRVVVATGGISYPSTGSTGDGYEFARKTGHQVTELYPSLVPLETKELYAGQMQGLSLKNVEIYIRDGKKERYRDFGEMLFTHYGVSGPLILSASSYLAKNLSRGPLQLKIDLKPALTREQLDRRLLKDFEKYKNKQFKNSLEGLLPGKMIPVITILSGIEETKPVNEITKLERQQLLELFKGFPLTLTGSRSFREAVITKGGVSVKDIDPGTMESKRTKNLYFAGEVLDLDALTGGYNLQIAWSTAWIAAHNL